MKTAFLGIAVRGGDGASMRARESIILQTVRDMVRLLGEDEVYQRLLLCQKYQFVWDELARRGE